MTVATLKPTKVVLAFGRHKLGGTALMRPDVIVRALFYLIFNMTT